MTCSYKCWLNLILVSILCTFICGSQVQSNTKSPFYISIANGKEFLYLQKNFKKICHDEDYLSYPLWSLSIFPRKITRRAQESLETFAYQVRVLLDEFSDASMRSIYSEKGMIISSLHNIKKGYTAQREKLEIVFKEGSWYIDKKKAPCDQLHIRPIEGHLTFNDRKYAGSFLLIIDENRGYIINELDIEDYIYSVLRSESWPGWPIEVNKVFAIASRSYLVAKVLEAAKKKQFFHIKNTNIHQTYTGVHAIKNLKKAVEETKGVILAYDQQPIIAMFDACCGGIIPAHIENVVDFEKAPYLARDYACTFCKKYRIFSWQVEYPFHEVVNLLRCSGIHIAQLYDIQVIKSDSAGVVQEVMVHDGMTSYILNGKQCYSVFGNIKSFCFSIAKMNEKIVLSGRGYGHHLGLCQWGARALIDYGWDYKRILQFYYPGTDFVRLKTGCV